MARTDTPGSETSPMLQICDGNMSSTATLAGLYDTALFEDDDDGRFAAELGRRAWRKRSVSDGPR